MTPKKTSRTALISFLVVAVLGVGVWWAVSSNALGARKETVLQGTEVRRGPLQISVIERGNLRAADMVSLKSEIEGTTTILSLIKEGEHVEAGQLLCELDATSLVDKQVAQEIAVESASSLFSDAQHALEIQKSQNESDIAKAKQVLDFAGQDLTKYMDGDKPLAEQNAKQAIKLAEGDWAHTKETYEWSQKLADKGFLTNTELEADRLSANRSEILLDQAKRQLDLLENYEVPRKVQELNAAKLEAQRELNRVQLQAEARLADAQQLVHSNEAKLKLETEKLNKLNRQIAKAKIVAPKAGMVVYAKQDEGMRFGNAQPIQEGTSVRERQEIITIPNAGGMIAEASLHESVLKQVEIGMDVDVTVDALHNQVFKGHVTSLAVLPDQNSWWANPNLRLYKSTVAIDGATPEMRPGMSCSIEILCEKIPDAIYVPVQAIFRHKGENICFVAKGESYEVAKVEAGKFNDKWVQIVTGLTEGQRVLLSLPEGFKLEAGDEQKNAEGDATAPDAAQASMPPGMTGPGATPGGNGFPGGGKRGGGRGPRGGGPSASGDSGDGANSGDGAHGYDPSSAQDGGSQHRGGRGPRGGDKKSPDAGTPSESGDSKAPKESGDKPGGGRAQ